MTQGTVAIANDHAGVEMKRALMAELEAMGWQALDLGTGTADSVDYPDFGRAVADAVVQGKAARGVVICGTGIGISIAANRVPGVRAAVCHDATTARLARAHNDSNVMALGARVIGFETARDCLKAFLATAFDGGERHERRVRKLG
ncbi:MAG: ribose 5-phosphate isomerase B [Alphaproteobacteria bacterium]|nr:ribose 5-phosphate isomerase B [Alphaproteobacteria bacterium]